MAEPFLAEIRVVSFNFAPNGWALCNGQILPINQNQALFSLLGTTYGGNGQTTFALPDLRSRVPLHVGGSFSLGQNGGEETHTLSVTELPLHTHLAAAQNGLADQASPLGGVWANGNVPSYTSAAPDATLAPGTVLPAGGSQPHENVSPYLVLNFIIALQGIFPSRN